MPRRRRHDALRELGLFALAYLVYFGVRAITEGTAATAVENAVELVRLEQRLGIAWEQAVQDAVVASGTLLDAANAVYIYGHWPVIVVGASCSSATAGGTTTTCATPRCSAGSRAPGRSRWCSR